MPATSPSVSASEPDGLSLLTVEEVAAILGVSGEAVRQRVRAGKLAHYRLSDTPKARIRISSSAVAELLRAGAIAARETR